MQKHERIVWWEPVIADSTVPAGLISTIRLLPSAMVFRMTSLAGTKLGCAISSSVRNRVALGFRPGSPEWFSKTAALACHVEAKRRRKPIGVDWPPIAHFRTVANYDPTRQSSPHSSQGPSGDQVFSNGFPSARELSGERRNDRTTSMVLPRSISTFMNRVFLTSAFH